VVGASTTADICKRHRVPPNVAGQNVPKAVTCDDKNSKQKAEMALNECILDETCRQMNVTDISLVCIDRPTDSFSNVAAAEFCSVAWLVSSLVVFRVSAEIIHRPMNFGFSLLLHTGHIFSMVCRKRMKRQRVRNYYYVRGSHWNLCLRTNTYLMPWYRVCIWEPVTFVDMDKWNLSELGYS